MTVAPQAIAKELESGAVRLCKKVGYASAGTVEYLYNGVEYTFLEVNPRLQVEHSVTEAITNINIPAVQLQVLVHREMGESCAVIRMLCKFLLL